MCDPIPRRIPTVDELADDRTERYVDAVAEASSDTGDGNERES